MKKLLIVIIIVIAGGIAYKVFFAGPASNAPTSPLTSSGVAGTSAPLTGQDDEIGKQFLQTLLSLKTISLNDEIFSKPGFKNLKDYTTELLQTDPKGRPNPFAPIGTDVGSIQITGTDAGTGSGSPTPPPTSSVTTLPAETITRSSAKFVGSVVAGTTVDARWFEFGTSNSILDTRTPNLTASAPFSTTVTTLRAGTTFYYHACVSVATVPQCGDTISFATLQ